MATYEAVAVLRRRWTEVLALVDDRARRTLDDLAGRLVAAGDRRERRRVWVAIAEALHAALPPDDPVRAALSAGTGRRDFDTELDTALDELRRVLAELDANPGPEPEEILAAAKAILLETPAYSAEELRSRGGDADARGVIRLPASDGVRLPAFQFGPELEPVPAVVAVNEVLGADADPWGAADWWLRGNAWLGGVPADLLGRVVGEALAAAARAEWGDQ